MTDHIKDLREKAEAATPGDWFPPVESAVKYGFPRWDVMARDGDTVKTVCRVLPIDGSKKQRQSNADYVAAANPETILALLTLNDRLVEALECANDRLKTHGTKHIATVRIASEALSAAKQFKKTGEIVDNSALSGSGDPRILPDTENV